MNKKLQIIETNGIQTVSARELYKGLEITDRFNRWFESLLKYGFEENQDFRCVKTSTQQNQYGGTKEIDDYSITLDMAKQICMLQRSEVGKKYRAYLIELEKAWNTPEAVMARALQLSNKILEEKKQQIALMQPKVDFYDKYCNSTNLSEIGLLGEKTNIGKQNIFKILKADKVIQEKFVDGIKYYEAYYRYEKYFKSIPCPFTTPDGIIRNRDKLMLTQEGMTFFVNKYGK